jgi:hypothetical protein
VDKALDKYINVCYTYIFKMIEWMNERNSDIHKRILSQVKICFTKGFRTLYYGVTAYLCCVALVKGSELMSRIIKRRRNAN